MTLNNKILPVALVAALLGGSVGAFVMRPNSNKVENPSATETTKSLNTVSPSSDIAATEHLTDANELAGGDKGSTGSVDESNLSDDEREAYRAGFVDGAKTLASTGDRGRTVTEYRAAPAATRVVYRDRTATRSRVARRSSARQVYYDYEQPRKRSFWSKHRDKLTVAGGAGAGAIIGGLVGGKKGAAIGALAGGGGSALYTYKLRKRNRNY